MHYYFGRQDSGSFCCSRGHTLYNDCPELALGLVAAIDAGPGQPQASDGLWH